MSAPSHWFHITINSVIKYLEMGSLLEIGLHFHLGSILTSEFHPRLFSAYRTKLGVAPVVPGVTWLPTSCKVTPIFH